MAEVLEPLEASLEAFPCGFSPFVLRLEPVIRLNDEQFFRFCVLNEGLRIERTAEGDIVLSPLKSIGSSAGNVEFIYQFGNWAKRDGTGRILDSSIGYILQNNAVRSPNLSWVTKERLRAVPKSERARFPHLCPDFVLELRSKTDSMREVKRKMAEYIACGARLGWLINPPKRQIFVYRPDAPVEEFHDPESLSGEAVLPGFVLQLADLWQAMAGE
ncbi:MAG TPA: Uma2 family endonuclease [Chthoniobacteraceae bacterium]|jgi:Uma2 family endonuclease|nr:Uma2 family endonuclease [Chthoniobacteraceae bacterium]